MSTNEQSKPAPVPAPNPVDKWDWTPNQLAFNPHYEPANTVGSTVNKP